MILLKMSHMMRAKVCSIFLYSIMHWLVLKSKRLVMIHSPLVSLAPMSSSISVGFRTLDSILYKSVTFCLGRGKQFMFRILYYLKYIFFKLID